MNPLRTSAGQYGALMALAMFAVLGLLPHPLGARLFWSACALHLLLGSWWVWSRMRFPWASASMASASLGLIAMAVAGVSPLRAESVRIMPMVACALAGIVAGMLMRVERRLHPELWEVWRVHVERCSLLDLILGRHIPNLVRDAGSTPAA